MRISILLRTAAHAIAKSLAGGRFPSREQKERAIDLAVKAHFGKHPPRRTTDAVMDPYFGIAARGRRGARARAAMMAEAFATTPVGKRNARGRQVSRKGVA